MLITLGVLAVVLVIAGMTKVVRDENKIEKERLAAANARSVALSARLLDAIMQSHVDVCKLSMRSDAQALAIVHLVNAAGHLSGIPQWTSLREVTNDDIDAWRQLGFEHVARARQVIIDRQPPAPIRSDRGGGELHAASNT